MGSLACRSARRSSASRRSPAITGAEIQAIVEGAVRQLFYQGKPLALMLADFLAARERIIPLYVRDTERVLAMENRAKGISEPVSSPDDSIWAPVATSLWGD